jgi:hypothetical protein
MKPKHILPTLIAFMYFSSAAQTIDSVDIPKGVVYKYVNPALVEKAKTIIRQELSDSVTYKLNGGIVFVGPVLWSRYKKMPQMGAITGGDMTIKFNQQDLSAKVTQTDEGFRIIWDQVRKEVVIDQLRLRKATRRELAYYWSVISFDIEEPLIIAESGSHRFLMNLGAEKLNLTWLDEIPDSVK